VAARFEGGSFITIYLSPKDYHRVHMPAAGTLRSTAYIPGDLFSVNGATAEGVDRLFARNERLVREVWSRADLIARWQAEFTKALASDLVKTRLPALGSVANGAGPAEFGALLRDDLDRWTRVAAPLSISLE
jgi:hypothetical protein